MKVIIPIAPVYRQAIKAVYFLWRNGAQISKLCNEKLQALPFCRFLFISLRCHVNVMYCNGILPNVRVNVMQQLDKGCGTLNPKFRIRMVLTKCLPEIPNCHRWSTWLKGDCLKLVSFLLSGIKNFPIIVHISLHC